MQLSLALETISFSIKMPPKVIKDKNPTVFKTNFKRMILRSSFTASNDSYFARNTEFYSGFKICHILSGGSRSFG